MLSPPERTLLGRLAVFVGGWTLEAAEVVCAGEGIEPAEVLDLLASLIAKSVLHREMATAQDRYGMLETIRRCG